MTSQPGQAQNSDAFLVGRAPTLMERGRGIALIVPLGAFLVLMRQVGVPSWDTVWAEDGALFLLDALTRPFFATLFEPAAGYMHLASRVLDQIAVLLPLENAALVIALLSSLAVSLLALFVFRAASSVLQSEVGGVALGALVLLLPAAGHELSANVANLHFYLIFAAFWALIWKGETRIAVLSRIAVVVIGSLSDPQVGVYLPLVAVMTLTGRLTSRSKVVALAFVLGLCVQAVVVVNSGGPRRMPAEILDLPDIFALRVAGSLIIGERLLRLMWDKFGLVFSYGALLLTSLGLVVGFTRANARLRPLIPVCVAYALVLFGLPLIIRGTVGWRSIPGEVAYLSGSRYMFVPILFMYAALIAAWIPRISAGGPVARRHPAATSLLVLLAAVLISNYPAENERSTGPHWRSQIIAARAQCASRTVTSVTVAISPSGWEVPLSCPAIR